MGGALLRGVIADCTHERAPTIHLEVRANNDAVRLYRKAGFARVGARRDYYRGDDGQRFDAHTYARDLD